MVVVMVLVDAENVRDPTPLDVGLRGPTGTDDEPGIVMDAWTSMAARGQPAATRRAGRGPL